VTRDDLPLHPSVVFSSAPLSDPLPAPPPTERNELGLADGSLRRLDPRYVACARCAGLAAAGGLALLAPPGLLVYWLGTDASALRLLVLAASCTLLVALCAWLAWAFPPLKYRHLSWRLSRTGLEIRRGVCFRHRISVPRDRVQHTDVTRGPLERRFGLATLIVHTAGSHDSQVPLEGLRHEDALEVRDFLLGAGGGDGS